LVVIVVALGTQRFQPDLIIPGAHGLQPRLALVNLLLGTSGRNQLNYYRSPKKFFIHPVPP